MSRTISDTADNGHLRQDKRSGPPGPGGVRRRALSRAQQAAMAASLTVALGVLARLNENNYGRLVSIADRFVVDRNGRIVTNYLHRTLEPGSVSGAWIRRTFNSVDPSALRRFLVPIMTSVVFRGPARYTLDDGREYPAPYVVLISPTMRCDKRCVGCYAANYTKKDDLSREEVESVISQARDIGARLFVILGGEPLVYEPLFDIFAKFRDCAFIFYTSGHLLNREKVERLVALGNVMPIVSVEGFREETDQRRGPGSFDQVMRAYDLLHDARIPYGFSVTATRLNLDAITSDDFFRLMLEKGPHFGFYFSYMPIGRDPDLSLMPTPEERNRLRLATTRFRETYPMMIADFWNDGAVTEGCLGGGRSYLHVNNRGDVEPCVFCHFAVDNIRNKPLAECLASDFFCALRRAAPYGRNLLMPCPIIDHPRVMRTLVRRHGAKPTHEGAETILTDMASHLDAYSKELKEIYDPVFAADYRWAAELHDNPRYDLTAHPPHRRTGTPSSEDGVETGEEQAALAGAPE